MPGMFDDGEGQSASLSDGGLVFIPFSEWVEADHGSVTLQSLFDWSPYAVRCTIVYDRLADRLVSCEVFWLRPVEVSICSRPEDGSPVEGLPDNASLTMLLEAMVAMRELVMADASLIFRLSTFS